MRNMLSRSPSAAASRARRRRGPALTSVTILLALALCSLALAAPAKKGATYSGNTVHLKEPITLKVSRSGKTVTVSETFAPLYCEGGGAGEREITKAVPVSSSGKFKAVISYEFVPEKKITSKLYVSGKFNGKKVGGTARSEFLLAHQCDGSTSFSASAG